MGVRESLLNTITSVADSDFVRVVTSAGASSKATVKNLFKGFESNLGAKSSLTTSDYIRVVGSDNEAYKQMLSDVLYANGVRFKVYTSGMALSDFADSCDNGITFTYMRTLSQAPDTPGSGETRATLAVYKTAIDEIVMTLTICSSPAEPAIYERRRFGSWGDWVKMATRAETDRLNGITKWYGYTQTTREALLAKIDEDISAIGQGSIVGYMVSTQSALLGLPAGSYYMTMYANSVNYREIRFTRIEGMAEYLLPKLNGTWASSPIALPTRSEVNVLNNHTKLNVASGSTVTSLSTFTAWVDSIAPSTGGCLIYVSSTIANNIGLTASGYYIQVYSMSADWRLCVAYVTGGNLIKTLAKPGAWQTTWKGTTLS